jgi:hypothetical protein
MKFFILCIFIGLMLTVLHIQAKPIDCNDVDSLSAEAPGDIVSAILDILGVSSIPIIIKLEKKYQNLNFVFQYNIIQAPKYCDKGYKLIDGKCRRVYY